MMFDDDDGNDDNELGDGEEGEEMAFFNLSSHWLSVKSTSMITMIDDD